MDSLKYNEFSKIDLIFLGLFFISWFHPILGTLFYLSLAFYWKCGVAGQLKALILLTTRGILSSAVAAAPAFSIVRWVLLIGSALIILISAKLDNHEKNKYNKIVLCVLLFDVVAILSCIWNCSFPVVSLFKLILFTVTFLAVLKAVSFTRHTVNWANYVSVIFGILFLVSFVLIPFARFRVTNNNFQGVFNHVNMLGIVSPVSIAFILNAPAFSDKRKVKNVLLIAILFMVFLSKSRSGMFASLGVLFVYMLFNKERFSKKMLGMLVLAIGVILCITIIPGVYESILSFIFKGNTDSIWASREDIAENHIERFNISPILGTGFMVPYSEGVMDLNFSFDLIVEPGNLVVMLLGDTGLLGFVSFLFLLITIIVNGCKRKLYLVVGAILICMGEMVFFSPNNMAVLLYVLIGVYLFQTDLDDGGRRNRILNN